MATFLLLLDHLTVCLLFFSTSLVRCPTDRVAFFLLRAGFFEAASAVIANGSVTCMASGTVPVTAMDITRAAARAFVFVVFIFCFLLKTPAQTSGCLLLYQPACRPKCWQMRMYSSFGTITVLTALSRYVVPPSMQF